MLHLGQTKDHNQQSFVGETPRLLAKNGFQRRLGLNPLSAFKEEAENESVPLHL